MSNWIPHWLRTRRSVNSQAQAHMTFGQTSVGKTVRKTGLFLKKQLWVWPIIAVLLLSIAGYIVSSSINSTMKTSLQSELTTLLNVERAMLEKWLKVQESNALTVANDPEIRKLILQILSANKKSAALESGSKSNASPELSPEAIQAKLFDELEATISSYDFVGFLVTDKHQRIIASETPETLAKSNLSTKISCDVRWKGVPRLALRFQALLC